MIAITLSYGSWASAVQRSAVSTTSAGMGTSGGSWRSTGSNGPKVSFRSWSGVGVAYVDVTEYCSPLSGHPSIVSDDESGCHHTVSSIWTEVGSPPANSQLYPRSSSIVHVSVKLSPFDEGTWTIPSCTSAPGSARGCHVSPSKVSRATIRQ